MIFLRAIAFQRFRRTKVLPQYLKALRGFHEMSRVALAPGGNGRKESCSKCDCPMILLENMAQDQPG